MQSYLAVRQLMMMYLKAAAQPSCATSLDQFPLQLRL